MAENDESLTGALGRRINSESARLPETLDSLEPVEVRAEAERAEVMPGASQEAEPAGNLPGDGNAQREGIVGEAVAESTPREAVEQDQAESAPTRVMRRSAYERVAAPEQVADENSTSVIVEAPAPAVASGEGEGAAVPELREEEMPKKKRRRAPLIAGGVIGVLALAYVGAGFYFADRVPAGTEVAGVQVGGMNRTEAAQALHENLAPRLAEKVAVTVGSMEAHVDPSSFSLGVDEGATVDSVVGFSLNPARLWAHVAGGENVSPVLTYDEGQLTNVVDNLADEVNTDPVDAAVTFDSTNVSVNATPAKAGITLNKESAVSTLSTHILDANQPIRLEATEVAPAITDEIAAQAVTEGQTLISDKVSVNVGERLVELTPAQLASAASYSPDGATLKLSLAGQVLGDAVRAAVPDVLKPGTDARIEIVNHTTPTVVPSVDGVGIDDEDLAAKVATAGTSSNRTASIEPTTVPAAFTTADAEALGVKEVVSEITTPLTNDSVRTQNLLTGTSLITNTLVKPGETFSLSAALGDITYERGFTSSGVVTNGFNSEALGGGLSQLSTNTFNIGYLAGMVDVEHKPHSKYFSRYPMGREATLWSGQIDMKWKNNTPYGAVIDTWVEGGSVHTQLWSTKYWDVSVTVSDPYNYVQPTTKNNPAADCEPSGAGGPGFSVKVARSVSKDGVEDKEASGGYTWTYQPVNAVTCN
ncbi:VanW family protein [Arcanobacterium haemolyticum]|nr:VanW family protein [Arcanobacterium haemolyticum]